VEAVYTFYPAGQIVVQVRVKRTGGSPMHWSREYGPHLFVTAPRNNPEWLRPELQQLLLEEPLQPLAVAWRAELEQTSALALLRKATDKWPDNWQAWLFRGDAAQVTQEKGSAYQKAVNLKPDSALAQERMALFLAMNGNPLDALSFAKQALLLAPWSASATATLAVVDAALEQCDEAFATQERARRLSVHGDLVKQLAEVERRCGAP